MESCSDDAEGCRPGSRLAYHFLKIVQPAGAGRQAVVIELGVSGAHAQKRSVAAGPVDGASHQIAKIIDGPKNCSRAAGARRKIVHLREYRCRGFFSGQNETVQLESRLIRVKAHDGPCVVDSFRGSKVRRSWIEKRLRGAALWLHETEPRRPDGVANQIGSRDRAEIVDAGDCGGGTPQRKPGVGITQPRDLDSRARRGIGEAHATLTAPPGPAAQSSP